MFQNTRGAKKWSPSLVMAPSKLCSAATSRITAHSWRLGCWCQRKKGNSIYIYIFFILYIYTYFSTIQSIYKYICSIINWNLHLIHCWLNWHLESLHITNYIRYSKNKLIYIKSVTFYKTRINYKYQRWWIKFYHLNYVLGGEITITY